MMEKFDTNIAIKYFLNGQKVRRTVWKKDEYVQLRTDGSYQFIVEDKKTIELFTPTKSLEKFGFNSEKMWELSKSNKYPFKINNVCSQS